MFHSWSSDADSVKFEMVFKNDLEVIICKNATIVIQGGGIDSL